MVDYLGDLNRMRGRGATEERDHNSVMTQFKVLTDTVVYQCWEFAEHRGQGVFLLFHFDENRLGILVQSEYGLHDITELHSLEGGHRFSNDAERLNRLHGEMEGWMERARNIFKLGRALPPRKIWVMRDFTREETNSKRVLDYTPASTPLLDFENALEEWRDVLSATGWQNFLI